MNIYDSTYFFILLEKYEEIKKNYHETRFINLHITINAFQRMQTFTVYLVLLEMYPPPCSLVKLCSTTMYCCISRHAARAFSNTLSHIALRDAIRRAEKRLFAYLSITVQFERIYGGHGRGVRIIRIPQSETHGTVSKIGDLYRYRSGFK